MKGCPVTYKGKTYPSILAASKAIGRGPRTIGRHLDKYGHLDNLDAHGNANRPAHNRKPVVIAGMRFDSMTEAAQYVGMSTQHFGQTIKGQTSKGCMDRLIARFMRAQMEGRKRRQSP